MGTFVIKKGKDIPLKGSAKKEIIAVSFPKRVAVQPPDLKGLRLRLMVDVGDDVKVGTTILSDKADARIGIASPAGGKIVAINRGEKRALLSVVIETDGLQETEKFQAYNEEQIESLSREEIIDGLLKGSLWPVIRQRPFSKIANPQQKPKAIFVHAMNTEPLALDCDVILRNKEEEFQLGLNILRRLSDGDVHLCVKEGSESKALIQSEGVQMHAFSGPHPAGNVSTHIHCVDPVHKGDIVWYVEAQDVLRITSLFLKGVYPVERIVAVTGEGAEGHQIYAKTIIGAPLATFVDGKINEQMRYISGSVLTGKDVGAHGFLRCYDTQVTILPEGGKREFLGWLMPGLKKYTFSKTFVSSFLAQREVSLDSDIHGSKRAIVLNNIYDSLVPLDVMTYFLLKAVLSENIEEAEELGILECDEEDFALCTFACPSKTDVGGIIARGLELIEKES